MSKILCSAVLLVSVVAVAALSPGCAHVQPIANDAVTCSGQTIPAADVTMVFNDISTHNYADLVANVLPLLHDGWNDLVCVIDALEAQNPQLKPAGDEFKRQHAVEIRSARAASASRARGDGAPGRAGGGGAPPGRLVACVGDGR